MLTKVLRTEPGCGEARRRRECTGCGHRFFTVERTEDEAVGDQAKARRFMREMRELADEFAATGSDRRRVKRRR